MLGGYKCKICGTFNHGHSGIYHVCKLCAKDLKCNKCPMTDQHGHCGHLKKNGCNHPKEVNNGQEN